MASGRSCGLSSPLPLPAPEPADVARLVRTVRWRAERAEDGWFLLHAGVRIPANDRVGFERLCRYVARPPLSHERLTRREDGLLQLRLKTPWPTTRVTSS